MDTSKLGTVLRHTASLASREFKWAHSSRQVFKWLQDTLTDIQRAARFYYLQQNCFGGKL
jgi:DNA adenine methylase